MDDAVITPHGASDGVRRLAASLTGTTDGVGLAYEILEDVVARHGLDDARMVVQAGDLGTQIFRHARRAVTGAMAADLLAKPQGIYADDSHAHLATGAAFAGMCSVALAGQAARRAAAVDRATGLATRPAIEGALARSVARAARYDWACTAVLLATAGDARPDRRWHALCRALRVAVRSGDEAGVAGAGRALVIVGAAGPDVVRPLVGRVRAALTGAGDDDIDLLAATASAPHETVDPAELWRLASERLAEVVPATGTPEGQDPATLELALRSLESVVAVGTAPAVAGGAGPVVTVVTAGSRPDGPVERAVRAVVDEQLPGATVVLEHAAAGMAGRAGAASEPPEPADPAAGPPSTSASPPPSAVLEQELALAVNGRRRPANGTVPPPELLAATAPAPGPGRDAGRVTLISAAFEPDSGTSEVRLARGSARGTGRAAAGPLAGGAQATLNALTGLRAEIPFYLVSAERARTVPGDPVVVVLAPRRSAGGADPPGPPERIGVASGPDDVHAAARATLAALNRYLEPAAR